MSEQQAPFHGLNGIVAYLNDRVAVAREDDQGWEPQEVAEELSDLLGMLTVLRDAVQWRCDAATDAVGQANYDMLRFSSRMLEQWKADTLSWILGAEGEKESGG